MLTGAQTSQFTQQALDLVLTNSMPTMLAAAVAGLAIALLQALTQIQDQGLPTAIKFFAVMFTLYATYTALAGSLATYGDLIFTTIASI